MKTSKLICMILQNEGKIELSIISKYIKILVQEGYISVDGTKISLTEKGKAYTKI